MRKAVIAGLFLLPVAILLLHLGDFAFQVGAPYTDMLISHYPNGLFLQRAVQHGDVPLWSDSILSGYPFAANPLSGLFYPPGWIALLLPLPAGFNLLMALHLVWGGLGMYRLLRAEGLSQPARLLGALSWLALPKLYSHIGAGHLSLLYATAWTPWLLVAERRAGDSGRMRWLLPGAVLGMIALADVRWAAYSGVLWIAYSLYLHISATKPIKESGINRLRLLRTWVVARLTNTLFALLAAAAVLLPLAQFTQLTTRDGLAAQDRLFLSLPPGQIFGLVYPPITGSAEWVFYPGAIACVLMIYVIGDRKKRQRAGFWLALIFASLVFALGSFIPGMEAIMRLPGLNLLRVPARALFLTGMGFACVAAYGFEFLINALICERQKGRDIQALVLFGAAALVTLLAVGASVLLAPDILQVVRFGWGGLFFLAATIVLLLGRAKKLSLQSLTVLLLSIQLIDLMGVSGLSLDFRTEEEVFAPGMAVAARIQELGEGSPFRVYSPSYSLPQHVSAMVGMELADGVDPLQLSAYVDYMESATGVKNEGYSVTLPPMRSGDPAEDNRTALPDAGALGLLNVRFVAAEYPLEAPGLRLVSTVGTTLVYENERVLPRAWIQSPELPPGEGLLSTPEVQRGINWMTLETDGPGLLVLSELAYPGWEVTVDGRPAEIEVVAGILRGVRLDGGVHSVRFDFHPGYVYSGIGLSLLAWASLWLLWLKGIRR